jgi:hypothetical protein
MRIQRRLDEEDTKDGKTPPKEMTNKRKNVV